MTALLASQAVLRRIESRGAGDTAHRAHQNCGHEFRDAVATGRDVSGQRGPARDPHAQVVVSFMKSGRIAWALRLKGIARGPSGGGTREYLHRRIAIRSTPGVDQALCLFVGRFGIAQKCLCL